MTHDREGTRLATNLAMAESRSSIRLTIIGTQPSAPRACDCRPWRCQFQIKRIAWLLETMDTLAQEGWYPGEALASVLADHERSLGKTNTWGGGSVLGAAELHAEVVRAIRAGKRDPASIAAFLCPERGLSDSC